MDDFFTGLLMQETYRQMLAGARPSLALQQAQQWLRTLPKSEILARLEEAADRLEREKQWHAWQDLPPGQLAHVLHRLAAMKWDQTTLREEAEDRPFAHPLHWAAFAVYGI